MVFLADRKAGLPILNRMRYICCTTNMPAALDVESERDLVTTLREALPQWPGIYVKPGAILYLSTSEHPSLDAELQLMVAGRPVRLLVQTRRGGGPREIRDTAERLEALRDPSSKVPTVPLIAAPRLPARGRELLRGRKLGYWDLSGSFYLEVPWAVYFIDRPPLPERTRKRRNIYRGRSAQVLHALLIDSDRPWHLYELAARAQTSIYVAHQVCTFLEEQLWMERHGRGPASVRVLREPALLLDAWASAHSLDAYRFRRYYRWAQSWPLLREAVCTALEGTESEYAVTLSAGAELVAPFATTVERLTLIVPESVPLQQVIEAAELRPVEDGENIAFMLTPERSPFLFRRRVSDVWVASPIQLYLDLAAWPQRGREQAQHLRSQELPY